MIFSAKSDTLTTDEGVHLFAGYTYLTKGDFRLDPEHPPLIKELAALPLLFMKNLNVELGTLWSQSGNYYYDSWQEARILGEKFLFESGNNQEVIIFWGRFVGIVLTLILGWFAYFWAKKLYGEKAGIFAVFLTLLFPNILAHGRLINTDLGLTLFAFIAVYFWGEFLKKKGWLNFIFTGLFSGFAMASKYTAIILFFILLVLLIVKLVQDRKEYLNSISAYIGILIITTLVVWGSYGFSLQAPADFYKGFIFVTTHALGGHGSFLLGQNSSTGWWYYFPVAIFFKTPIPIFILFALTLIYFRKIKSKDKFDELLVILPMVIFLGFAMYSKANLGIRHILPIFPFLFLFISKSINILDFKKELWVKIMFGVLIIWYTVSALIQYPNYIAYFNEFAGGSKNGHKILTDSNLDWGQDIVRIQEYINNNDIKVDYLVYPWDGDRALRYYDLNYPVLEPENINARGNVIISATYYETEAYSWLNKFPMQEITPGVFLVTIQQ